MFLKIIHIRFTGVGILFFLTVFLMGILWGSVNYDGLADTLSNHVTGLIR